MTAETEPAEATLPPPEDWGHFRVEFRYFNPEEGGPHFPWTTVFAPDAERAVAWLLDAREGGGDRNVIIEHVREVDDTMAWYDRAEIHAQRTPEMQAALERRELVTQLLALADAELHGTLSPAFGTGYGDLFDSFLREGLAKLQAAGVLEGGGDHAADSTAG